MLEASLQARAALVDPDHETAFRVFNGFYEGQPALAIDLYARTLVIHDYSGPAGDEAAARQALAVVQGHWPWVKAALWKVREAPEGPERNGRLLLGEKKDLDRKIRENGVWYAVSLDHHQDASLYLDTRNLRAWAKEHLAGKRVLNTFAYTGSLGVAARAAPASEVVHLDLNRAHLNIGKVSYELNKFPLSRADFRVGDFFDGVSHMKKEGALFDCVFLDPPFFSQTRLGKVDLEKEADRLVNKVRPLVGHEGWLVVVNNALFLSGAEWTQTLERLCADGYMSLEERIPVPADFTGYPETRVSPPPADPAPFNHSTKIAVLRVRRKDGRPAGE